MTRKSLLLFSCKNGSFGDKFVSEIWHGELIMFAVKVLGKIIAILMILVMTVLFYAVTIFSRIYGLAATVFNLVIMLCAIIALVLQQWNNLRIAVAILVISYLLMGAWNIVAAFFASAKEFFTGVLFA